MEKPIVLYALHGFLGLPEDWDFLRKELSCEVITPNLFTAVPPSTGVSLTEWAARFNESVSPNSENYLLGYSMGGRLALHSLLADAEGIWKKAALVSTGLGLAETDRPARLESDRAWARRFREENWADVCAAWNSQPVFGGEKQTLPREESDFDREELAAALGSWSIAKQEDLRNYLGALKCPVTWIAGERDLKYASTLPSPHVLIPGAHHRAPWENPSEFLKVVRGIFKI